MDIGPQYSDYLDWFNSRQGSEGNAHPMSQGEFDNLPMDQKWFNVSGGLDLKPNDPRYQQVQNSVPGLEPGRTIGITPGDSLGSQFTDRFVNGADSLYKGNGWYASAANQRTPKAEQFQSWSEGPGPWMLASVLGGAALGNAGLLGATGEAGGAAGGYTPFEGGYPEAGGGTFGGGATPAWATPEGAAPSGGGYGGWGPDGAISPETAGGAGGMGVGQNGIGPGGLGARLAGAISNPSSLMSGDGLLAALGRGAMSNPLQAIGLLQTGAGLLGGLRGGTSGSSPSSGGSKGGSGSPMGNVSRGAWTPNPVTARQIQNYRYVGS